MVEFIFLIVFVLLFLITTIGGLLKTRDYSKKIIHGKMLNGFSYQELDEMAEKLCLSSNEFVEQVCNNYWNDAKELVFKKGIGF